MTKPKTLLSLSACAGLLLAPSAWIINTQLGQILPYLDCQRQAQWSAIASFVAAAAACVAGVTSWRSVGRAQISEPLRTLAFVGSLGALAALLFAFALAMQGWASLVLSGCER